MFTESLCGHVQGSREAVWGARFLTPALSGSVTLECQSPFQSPSFSHFFDGRRGRGVSSALSSSTCPL
jgi:hypothetical protein